MKKLKSNPVKLEEQKKNPLKKKIIFKRTGDKKCDFFFPDGTQCGHRVKGKGNFCIHHATNMFPNRTQQPLIQNNNSIFVKYDPINHPRMYIELSAMGLNTNEIAAHLKISLNTINEWRESDPFFDQAYEIGKSALEAWYLRQGKNNLDNRFYQTGLYKFLTMNNGMGWSDKAESKSQVQGQFGVLLVPGQMSMDEWEAQNIQKEEELQKRLQAEEFISDSDTVIEQE